MFDNSTARPYSAYRGVICLIIVGKALLCLQRRHMFDNSRARHYSAYRGVICLIIVGQGTTLLTEASYV